MATKKSSNGQQPIGAGYAHRLISDIGRDIDEAYALVLASRARAREAGPLCADLVTTLQLAADVLGGRQKLIELGETLGMDRAKAEKAAAL